MKKTKLRLLERIPGGYRLGACLFLIGFALVSFGTEKPTIVVVLVDDMGYGDPRCFDPQSKIATPSLDRLAREVLRFTAESLPGGHNLRRTGQGAKLLRGELPPQSTPPNRAP